MGACGVTQVDAAMADVEQERSVILEILRMMDQGGLQPLSVGGALTFLSDATGPSERARLLAAADADGAGTVLSSHPEASEVSSLLKGILADLSRRAEGLRAEVQHEEEAVARCRAKRDQWRLKVEEYHTMAQRAATRAAVLRLHRAGLWGAHRALDDRYSLLKSVQSAQAARVLHEATALGSLLETLQAALSSCQAGGPAQLTDAALDHLGLDHSISLLHAMSAPSWAQPDGSVPGGSVPGLPLWPVALHAATGDDMLDSAFPDEADGGSSHDKTAPRRPEQASAVPLHSVDGIMQRIFRSLRAGTEGSGQADGRRPVSAGPLGMRGQEQTDAASTASPPAVSDRAPPRTVGAESKAAPSAAGQARDGDEDFEAMATALARGLLTSTSSTNSERTGLGTGPEKTGRAWAAPVTLSATTHHLGAGAGGPEAKEAGSRDVGGKEAGVESDGVESFWSLAQQAVLPGTALRRNRLQRNQTSLRPSLQASSPNRLSRNQTSLRPPP